MPTSPRRIAVQQLQRVEESGAYVGLVSEAFRDAGVSPRDDRLAVEYVAGVTRWRRYLDFLISHYARGNAARLDAPLRQILRVALYELLFQNTPPHAAVNEAVALTKEMVRPQAGRLTNGLLRSFLRNRNTLPEPRTKDDAERLAIVHSHPTWMVRRWLDTFGRDETEALLRSNNQRPEFGLRVNTRRTSVAAVEEALTASGVMFRVSKVIPYFLRVQQLQPVLERGLLERGLCAVQDEAAGLIVRVLDPQPDEWVLDLCAAPGGKALHAVQLMGDRGRLLAVDVHAGRLGLVERAAEAQGATILFTKVADARFLTAQDVGTFDRVLLDAPCSGLGVLARRADLRWNRREDDLDRLTALQDELLRAAADLVRPNGLLVYATCSIVPEENEQRVEAFLARDRRFIPEHAGSRVPDDMITVVGHLAALPHRHNVDGAFAARLRRIE